MKRSIIFFLVLISFSSCEKSRLKKEAEILTKSFFSALGKEYESELKKLYSDFDNFESYYKSDTFSINKIDVKEGFVVVDVNNRFTNGFGKRSDREIKLILRKDVNGNLEIKDSMGLSGIEDSDDFTFAVKVGCLDIKVDTTDQQKINAISYANLFKTEKFLEVYLELLQQVEVTSWDWRSGYGGSASGKGIVKNNSDYSIPSLKYKITYKDRAGSEITSDDGYISYNPIKPGESKSFTFYTSYVGNAERASINLEFEDEHILNYLIKSKEWTGNECSEYKASLKGD